MKKRENLAVGAILLALLLVGTVWDLSISQALYRPGTGLAVFFEQYGGYPANLVLIFSSALMVVTRKPGAVGGVQAVFFGLLAALFSALSAYDICGNFGLDGVLGTAVLTGVHLALFFALAHSVRGGDRAEIRRAAAIGILLFFYSLILVNGIKSVWSRPRFYSIYEDLSRFAPWYLPQARAAGDQFQSFPSGHSASAAFAVWITLLPGFVPRLEGRRGVLLAIACVWTACVMLSRIVAGMHFLSDVAVGAATTVIGFSLLCWLWKTRPDPAPTHTKNFDQEGVRGQ